MRKLLLLSTLCFPLYLCAQQGNKSVQDAFLITRMAVKFHVQPKAVDDEFSNNVFTDLLAELDEKRMFFTKEDLAKLEVYRLQIDDQVKNRKPDFLNLLTSICQLRLQQADTMIDNLCAKPINFSVAEKFTVAEDTSYPADVAAMRIKLYKNIKASMLDYLVDDADEDTLLTSDRKLFDSAELLVRNKVKKIYKRYVNKILETPQGIKQEIGDRYCEVIAMTFDPHTEYFPLTEKENFESELGNKPFRFGFSLSEDDKENVVVKDLKPGSPAYKSGLLNKGDKILSIQWEGKQNIDVTGADRQEVSNILDASNHDKATFTVKKSDGSTRQVVLAKEKMSDDNEDNKVRSFILKGAKNIGFISLPAFYTDWENDDNEEGCAGDVAKEILKLEKENIQGLILDLRYNGGGSMREAIDLAGIFIDAGPVGQVKDKDGKVFTLKDVNRGTVYDGPLLILVNGYSASASEMLAGTLQDYNRAVIAGSDTYGKESYSTNRFTTRYCNRY